MPELPDIHLYIERLQHTVGGQRLQGLRLHSPFLLRTVTPRVEDVVGRRIVGFRRLGKRIVFELDDDYFLVLHLMIAGRLRWKKAGVAIPRKGGLAAFDFTHGSLLLTEASTRKRASLHVVHGEDDLRALDPGGLEVLDASLQQFAAAMRRQNRTLKRALTDPSILSGIGNAYSDEILHRARLSPLQRTRPLQDEAMQRLYDATRSTLQEWIDRLMQQVGDGFPDKVTAFRPEMAVHGRYRQACPVCGQRVQRIRYAENESNYCPTCQTGGRLLADRALSRLLGEDWPRTLEELEDRLTPPGGS
jgi:formamidopyrimidine-DNA glycosylase